MVENKLHNVAKNRLYIELAEDNNASKHLKNEIQKTSTDVIISPTATIHRFINLCCAHSLLAISLSMAAMTESVKFLLIIL